MTTKNERIIKDVKQKLAALDVEPTVLDAVESALRSLTSDWAPALIQGSLKTEHMTSDLDEVIEVLQILRRQIEIASREQALLPIPRRMAA